MNTKYPTDVCCCGMIKRNPTSFILRHLVVPIIISICHSVIAKVTYEDDFTGCVNQARGMVCPPFATVIDNSVFQQGYGDDLNEPNAWVHVGTSSEMRLYTTPIPISIGKADACFDFRLLGGDSHAFDIELSSGEKRCRIPIPSAGVGIRLNAKPGSDLVSQRIYSFAIAIEKEKAKVFLAEYRGFRQTGETEIGFIPDSFNIIATGKSRFCLTRLRVTDGDGLPDFSAARLYASRDSIEQPIENGRVAATNETVAVQFGSHSSIVFILGETNRTATLRILTEEKPISFPIHIISQRATTGPSDYGWKRGDEVSFSDATIKIGNVAGISIKPSFGYFSGYSRISTMGIDILRERDRLPSASLHPLDIGLVKRGDKVELWADGSFAGLLNLPPGRKVTGAEIRFDEGVTYKIREDGHPLADPCRFTILDLAANPRAKTFARAKSHFGSDANTVFDGIPMSIAKPIDSADLSICHQAMGNWWFEVDPYMERNPQNGFPGEVHFRVPAAPYGRAGVLFAIDPDSGKDAVLTLRLGHFLPHSGGSGSKMLGDKTWDFSEGVPDWCRKVGEIEHNGRRIPLFFGDFPLNIGGILDEFTEREYLDFEAFGRPWENFQQLDNRMKPDPESFSALSLFGITLQKMPWSVIFKQNRIGNVYTVEEKDRGMSVGAVAVRDGVHGRFEWTCLDVDGHEVFSGSEDFAIGEAGKTNDVFIAFGDETPVGHYSLEIRGFYSDKAEPDFVHSAAFAIVPAAGRNVDKFKSPYATWWATAHGSPSDPDVGFPLLTKMGVKRITCHPLTAEEREKWDVTDNGALTAPRDEIIMDDGDPRYGQFRKGEEWFVEEVRKQIAKLEKADHMLVWWESGPWVGVPGELLGGDVNPDDKAKRHAMYLNEVGRIMRKHFPEIRLQIGNLSSSMGAASVPFRAGAKAEYYDSIGIETTGQTIAPEHRRDVGLLGMLAAQDVASRYAGRKIPLDGCLEFICRSERNMGPELEAQWSVRDNLICLAHNFHLISTAGAFECMNAYLHSIWGGGSLQRSPYLYPYKKYVSYAVFTKTFDDVVFTRPLETGSTTVYALEFKRADGKYITAFWCARGEAEFNCEADGGATEISIYGKETAHKTNSFTFWAGGRATYLVSGKQVSSAKIVQRTFKCDETIAGCATSTANIPKTTGIEIAPDPAIASIGHEYFPVMKPGVFQIRDVDDKEKGECVEVSLDMSYETNSSPYYTEYTTLRFKDPLGIAGAPEMIGAWVKGDSNWGQLRFEIEDASGRIFKNVTARVGGYADGYDWPGDMAVNFDGWSFVHIAFRDTPLSPALSPGRRLAQWGVSGSRKDAIEFPIKVTAISVGINRRRTSLFGYEDKPGPATIRIKSISGCSSK